MSTRRIYLAARYSRHPEMREIRDALTPMGYTVTSRWIDQHNGQLASSFTPETLNADPHRCAILGQHDVDDLAAADIVISFTSADGGGKGGRHVEHGLALGMGKRVIVCGPRENIFHTLSEVEHFEAWEQLAEALAMRASLGWPPDRRAHARTLRLLSTGPITRRRTTTSRGTHWSVRIRARAATLTELMELSTLTARQLIDWRSTGLGLTDWQTAHLTDPSGDWAAALLTAIHDEPVCEDCPHVGADDLPRLGLSPTALAALSVAFAALDQQQKGA